MRSVLSRSLVSAIRFLLDARRAGLIDIFVTCDLLMRSIFSKLTSMSLLEDASSQKYTQFQLLAFALVIESP